MGFLSKPNHQNTLKALDFLVNHLFISQPGCGSELTEQY